MRIGEAHRPLRTIVCDEIRQRILTHTYPPGMRLVEEHLGEELGVSRNPVREALRVLEAEGFVEIVPRRGAVVASMSVEQSEELYEVLLALESLAAQLAAEKSDASDTARLLDVVERCETAEAEADYAQVAELNSEFHSLVLELARNPHLESVLTQLRHRNRRFSHIGPPAVARLGWIFSQKAGARGRDAVAEHRELADAITSGDGARAAEIARKHIVASRNAYAELAGELGDETLGTAPFDPSLA